MRFAWIAPDESRTGTLAIVQDEGTFLAVTPTLSAFGEITGREVPTVKTPLDALLLGTMFTELVSEAVETLTENGIALQTFPPDVPVLAPLPRPNRILAIGRNYAKHAEELGNTVGEEPIVFLKASSSVIGPGEAIVLPEWLGQADYEAELLVVIGKGGKDIAEADAMEYVAGYSLFNDVTAREKQRALQEKKHPWFLAKSPDTFGPLGPYLVSKADVTDPHALTITCRVNGEVRQHDSTGKMIFPIPYLIAFLSQWMALEPGDVIATGTPSGVGALKPGDSVSVEIEAMGALTNPVIAG
ncbi:MAG: fumarylacetoacetate hydrolase family protein [Armatimonadaceae bacterium]